MNELIVCRVDGYDGQFMIATDYNNPDATFFRVFVGQSLTGAVKTQMFPRVGELVLIGIDDEERAHFLKSLYTEENTRPFESVETVGLKHGDTEIRYTPSTGNLDINVSGKVSISKGDNETYAILLALIDTLISAEVFTADGPAPFLETVKAELRAHKDNLSEIGG